MEEKKRMMDVKMTDAPDLIGFFKSMREPKEDEAWVCCFARYIGAEGDGRSYAEMITTLDNHFAGKRQSVCYYRTQGFVSISDPDAVLRITGLYEKWLLTGEFPISCSVDIMKEMGTAALNKVVELFDLGKAKATESMRKNFIVKVLGWAEYYLPKLYPIRGAVTFPKLAFVGSIKEHEYLFCYFLHLLGCDVLYLNPVEDIDTFSNPLKSVSRVARGQNTLGAMPPLPVFLENNQASAVASAPTAIPASAGAAGTQGAPIRIQIGQRPGRTTAGSSAQQPPAAMPSPPAPREDRELSYEELALKANSVVMLKVYDEKEECFKTGSGVIISENGYILTNYHVIAGGASYGIQFESEEKEFFTTDIIKCHSFNDLAILRVDRKVAPILLYAGSDIPRGKQVVAIGSPLGLLNTVSNGIVSGFRNIGDVSMIQFTAPTSHGSSGGALLDMWGRMIGIITCGFDDGQNLNLAVDYKTIYPFIRGFLG